MEKPKEPQMKDKLDRPPHHEPKITMSPRLREVYICDFPPAECAHQGEFYRTREKTRRPVVIISKNNRLDDVVTVLAMTTKRQTSEKHFVKIESPFHDHKASMVICNKPMTIATTRLEQPTKRPLPRVSEEDFTRIMMKVHNNICGYYFPVDIQGKLAEVVGSQKEDNQSMLDAIRDMGMETFPPKEIG